MKKMLLITSLTRNVIQRFTDTTYLLRHALNIYIFRLKSMTFCDLMEFQETFGHKLGSDHLMSTFEAARTNKPVFADQSSDSSHC